MESQRYGLGIRAIPATFQFQRNLINVIANAFLTIVALEWNYSNLMKR